MEVTLQEILTTRENRVAKQQELLARFSKPLICFTMNIAGPEKSNEDILWGYELGKKWLQVQLKGFSVLHFEERILPTGCEGYFVVDGQAEILKHRTCQIEDSAPVARLFDMDVLDSNGRKLERGGLGHAPRKCLICDSPAHICGRSRAHSVAQLQDKTAQLLKNAMVETDCAHIAKMAQQALLYEVCTTPKPGLVDTRNTGSHRDMDIFTFMASSAALIPYFTQCAKVGAETRHLPSAEVFDLLRFPGKLAEEAMYQATKGVNTHKGSIFSLGILCAVAGRLGSAQWQPEALSQLCKEMTRGLVARELENCSRSTNGEKIYAAYGVSGARGQAESGYRQVLEIGLPVLQKGLQMGLSLNEAGCGTLLALIAATEDTNLIRRSSLAEQKAVAEQLQALLKDNPYPSKDILEQLDDSFIQRNLSPGGCADLLAITYFLHFLCS